MEFMPWKEEYSVGVALFDDQHKKMFGFINDLYDEVVSVKKSDVLSPTLAALVEYAKKHFKDEEDNLKFHNFPELTHHEEEHNKLTKNVNEFVEELKNSDSLITMKVIYFLLDWIMDHILDTDKKYSQFLKGKKITEANTSVKVEPPKETSTENEK